MACLWIFVLGFVAGASAVSERIVGGRPTTIDKYPSTVQVERYSVVAERWGQLCAGSVLTSRYILSAAHCFSGIGYAARYTRIRAGTSFRHSGGTVSYVDVATNHPTFGQLGNDGDITVVRLLTPLTFSSVIMPATIAAPQSIVPDNTPVIKVGWGVFTSGGMSAGQLRHVDVYTINNDLCRQRYDTLPFPAPVTRNMICAGLLDVGGKDACDGDSGGPVFARGVVVGIVAWGVACGNPTFPGVNTAVAPYTDWIISVAR